MKKLPPQDAGSYALVLRDLRARRDRLEVLVKSFEEMMRSEGISLPLVSAGGAVPIVENTAQVFDALLASVRPGEFHNMSLAVAAKAILSKTNRHPLTTTQIMEIIEHSGRKVEGKTPNNTVYSALLRSQDFAKVQKNTWGLAEWYPEKRSTGRGDEP